MSLAIHWFRKGLRLHDNPTLVSTLHWLQSKNATSPQNRLLLIFILDPAFTQRSNIGGTRWRFLLESLHDLNSHCRAKGNRLTVLRGESTQVLERLFAARKGRSTLLSYEKDSEPHAVKRDAQVKQLCIAKGIEHQSLNGHTLYDVSITSRACPATYASFLALIAKHPKPHEPLSEPESLIAAPDSVFDESLQSILDELSMSDAEQAALGLHSSAALPPNQQSHFFDPNSKPASNADQQSAAAASSNSNPLKKTAAQTSMKSFFSASTTASSSNVKSSSASADVKNSSNSNAASIASRPAFSHNCYFVGGETEALRRMEEYCADAKAVRTFEKPKTSLTSLVPSTTTLSPYLKFGCLSPRTFYWRLQRIIAGHSSSTQPPVSLLGQLLWREFFHHIAHHTPNFDRMRGNSLCKQIDWIQGDEETRMLAAWKQAKTGYPIIDALMTQLRHHGWMHHLGRHLVACFLTRGDLYVSWEQGQAVFDELLVDADWSLNAANWQWLSASTFFHQYWRVYSPVSFAQKSDPQGDFIRHFLPVLRQMPAKYIYSPWLAPLAVQQQANCIIGRDYPQPIVDHKQVSAVNQEKHKQAYARAQNGKEKSKQVIAQNDASAGHQADTNSKPGPKQPNDASHKRASTQKDEDPHDDDRSGSNTQAHKRAKHK